MCFRKIAKGILLVSLCILLCACAKGKTPPKDRLPSRPYVYTLTQEQRQNYQSAVCYLIKRDGEDTYRIQYSDCGVTLSDGTLYTDYNGMAVEITSKAQESYFPALNLHGSSGSQGFTGFVALVDRQYNVARCFYLLNHAGSQGEPALATIQPVDAVAEEELLSGEYTGLPDFSEYKEVFFHVGTYYHLAYAEDGKPLPISQWEPTSMFIGYSFVFAQDIELRYVPLVGGDYYLLYEITDTQGNTYCSDLIPYQTEPTAAEEKKQPDITVKWKKGERQQLLWESDGVELYLSVEKDAYGNSEYALKAKNNTQNPISCIARDGLANGKVVCTTGRDLTVAPGKFVANEYAFSFGIADGSPELERIDTLQFSVEIQDRNSGKYILEPQTILVDMSQAWPVSRKHTEYFKLNEPALDALAQEQVLLETEYLRLTLIGAGQFEPSSIQNLRMTLKAENLSDRSQSLCLDGVVVNGMFMRTDINITLPAGGMTYVSKDVSENHLKNYVGSSIASLMLSVKTYGQERWINPSVERHWIPVLLEESGNASAFQAGTLLWETNGVRIGSLGYDEKVCSWTITLVNNSQQGVNLTVTDAATGEVLAENARAGENQTAAFKINAFTKPSVLAQDPSPLAVRFYIYDFDGDTLLVEQTQAITLPME